MTEKEKQAEILAQQIEQDIAEQPVQEPTSSDVSDQAVLDMAAEADLDKKYGDSEAESALYGALDSLTLGGFGAAATKAGLIDKERYKEVINRNRTSYDVADIGTSIGTTLLTGGGAGIAKGAATAAAKQAGKKSLAKGITKKILSKSGPALAESASKATEKALAKLLKENAKDSAVKSIVKKALPSAAGSAIEAGLFTGQHLITEHTLGNAEITAENVMATLGSGALMGGIAGGIFNPKAIAPLGKSTKKAAKATGVDKKVDDLINKYSDPKKALVEYLEIPAARQDKFLKDNPVFVDEFADWANKNIDFRTTNTNKKIYENLSNFKDNAGVRLGKAMEDLDNISVNTPGIVKSRLQHSNKMIERAQSKIDELKNVPGTKGIRKALKKEVVDHYEKQAKRIGNVKPTELHEYKMWLDKQIKYKKGRDNFTDKEEAFYLMRDILKEEIDETAQRAWMAGRQDLADIIKTANKDYHYSSIVLPQMVKKINKKQVSNLGLKELVLGGALVGADPALGIAGGIARSAAKSDAVKRFMILRPLEKANQQVESKIAKGVNSFFKAGKLAGSAAKIGSLKALSKSSLAVKDRKEPKDNKEAYKNIKENLVEIKTNTEETEKKIMLRTRHLAEEAPAVTQFTVMTAKRATDFLLSKLPKPLTNNGQKNSFTKREWEPSDSQMAKFQRYVEAVENPLSVVDDLDNGTLTREAAEALQIVYPRIFQQLQEKVMTTLNSSEDVVPYNKRLQLGILLNIPTDESLQPEAIKGLQDNFVTEEEQQQIDSDDIEMSNREQTLHQQSMIRE